LYSAIRHNAASRTKVSTWKAAGTVASISMSVWRQPHAFGRILKGRGEWSRFESAAHISKAEEFLNFYLTKKQLFIRESDSLVSKP